MTDLLRILTARGPTNMIIVSEVSWNCWQVVLRLGQQWGHSHEVEKQAWWEQILYRRRLIIWQFYCVRGASCNRTSAWAKLSPHVLTGTQTFQTQLGKGSIFKSLEFSIWGKSLFGSHEYPVRRDIQIQCEWLCQGYASTVVLPIAMLWYKWEMFIFLWCT